MYSSFESLWGGIWLKLKLRNKVKVMGVRLMKFCHLLNIYGLLAL
jgi:hypothetical protein